MMIREKQPQVIVMRAPGFGMYIAKKKATFVHTWAGIAKSLWRYGNVEPGDFIEIKITVHREVK